MFKKPIVCVYIYIYFQQQNLFQVLNLQVLEIYMKPAWNK